MIWDSNPNFRINPDTDADVCQIGPKMLCIYSLVSMSHIAKYHKKSAGYCMRHANKSLKIAPLLRDLLAFLIQSPADFYDRPTW